MFSKNPFQMKSRQYPVDFAYPRSYTTRVVMSIPKSYEYANIPKAQVFTILGGKASCGLKIIQQNGQLNMIFQLVINDFYFEPSEYQELKSFFSKLSILQENLRITIKKK